MVDAISLKNNDAKLNTQKEAPKISLDADNLAELLSKGKTTSKSGESLQINGDLNSLYEDMGLGFKRNVGNDANGQEVKLCAFTGEKRAGQSSQKSSIYQYTHSANGNAKISTIMNEIIPGTYAGNSEEDMKPVTRGGQLLGLTNGLAPHKKITEESTIDDAHNALIESSIEYIIIHDGSFKVRTTWGGEAVVKIKNNVKKRIQQYLANHGYASEEEAKKDLISKGVKGCSFPFAGLDFN